MTGPAMTVPAPEAQRALAAHYYTDAEAWRADRALILNTWQLVGHDAQMPAPGDFITADLFDQSFFVIRDDDGGLRAYANVCPHRGHQLVKGCGNKSRISCPYHAWTFARDGRLIGLQRTPSSVTPTRADVRLFDVPVATLAGFVLINPSGKAPPLATFAPGLAQQIDAACPDLARYVIEDGPALGHSYDCAANWKVLIDNYLECHHCGVAHASFDDMMDIKASRFELWPHFTRQIAPTAGKSETAAFALNLAHDVTVGHFWWLFPNTVLGQFPGVPGFYASRFDPVSEGQTKRRSWSLTTPVATDPDMARRAQARSDWSVQIVSQEDRALCESVQIGLQHEAFRHGWYVTDPQAHGLSEHAMQHFHTLYLSALEAQPCISP